MNFIISPNCAGISKGQNDEQQTDRASFLYIITNLLMNIYQHIVQLCSIWFNCVEHYIILLYIIIRIGAHSGTLQ